MKAELKITRLAPVLTDDVREALAASGWLSEDTVVKRAAAATDCKAINENERSVERYISTRAVDRDNEVLDPQGVVLDAYLKNPVVLWAHNYSEPPIARAEWVKADDYGVISKTVYADTERAREVWELIRGGFLKTASVGFIPLARVYKGDERWRTTVQDYKKRWGVDLDKDGAEVITTKWALVEYSDVPIPSNPEALITAISKGLVVSDDLRSAMGLAKTDMPTEDEKPYPNEHACRLRDPDDFQPDSFRRAEREHEGKKYSVIFGRLKGEETMTEQAYRYPKGTWDAGDARAHCEDHDGDFEPAAEATGRVYEPPRPVGAEPEKQVEPEPEKPRDTLIRRVKQVSEVKPAPKRVVRLVSPAPTEADWIAEIAREVLKRATGKL